MFECPTYIDTRKIYYDKLRLYIPEFDLLNKKSLLDICLNGSCKFDFETNFNILRCTLFYLEHSKRFSI